ncbi:MAG: glutamate racemase [Acutalibacteraceae bacterium]
MNNNKPIGIFDSGLGGLTVVKSILDLMPEENIIYFGDTAHVPYGTRSREQITEYVMNDVRFLSGFDIKAIVIACNTADSVARNRVEEKYPLPVFGAVEPAAREAAAVTKNNRIGVIATDATVQSLAYEKAITRFNSDAVVISEACPLLVPLIENGRFLKGDIVTENVVGEYLEIMKAENIDTLVLGCTHYPLLTDIIRAQMPKINIVSSSEAAAKRLKEMLEKNNMRNCCSEAGEMRLFVSDKAYDFEKHAEMFMGRKITGSVLEVDPT